MTPHNPPGGQGQLPRPARQTKYEIAPITGRAALRWIADHHRHLPKLQGALFAVSVVLGEKTVGVATAGRGPREWEGTRRIVISRVAALAGLPTVKGHAAPVCTMLYRALCRMSKAGGYREAWSYTFPGEDGRSLRAAGFVYQGETAGGDWNRANRARNTVNSEPKGRWMRTL